MVNLPLSLFLFYQIYQHKKALVTFQQRGLNLIKAESVFLLG